MALTFSIKVRGQIGGKEFRAFEVTCDGSTKTIDAASIEMTEFDSAIVTYRQDLSFAVSVNLGSLADGGSNTSAETVAGAVLGSDYPLTALSVDAIDTMATAYVQAATKVEIVSQNEEGNARDIAEGVRRVKIPRYVGLTTLSGKYLVFSPALESADVFTVWALGH